MAGITVPIDGDLSPILATFAELPGRTQEEMQAVGEIIAREARRGAIAKGFAEVEGVSAASAKRAANAVIREMERAAQETKRANEAAAREAAAAMKAAEKAAKEAADKAAKEAAAAAREIEQRMTQAGRESAARFGDLKKGATVAFGGIVGDIEDVVGAFGAMGPAGIAAAAAIGVLAAGAAALWAEYKVVGMMYEFADATGQLKDEQAALQVAMNSTQETIGMTYVPVFEDLTTVVTAGVLAAGDLWQAYVKAHAAMMDFYHALPGFAKNMIDTVFPVLKLVDTMANLHDGLAEGTITLGGYATAAKRLQGQTEALKKAEDQLAKTNQLAADAAKKQDDADRKQHDAKIKRSATRQSTIKKQVEDEKKYEEDLYNLRGKQFLQEMEDDDNLTDQILGNIKSIKDVHTKSNEKYAAELDAQAAADEKRTRSAFDAELDRIEKLRRDRAQATQEYLMSGISAAATLAQAISDSAEEGSQAQQTAAIAAFRLNQAGSIGTIAVNTAEAITKAIALFGPPPSPAGIAGISFATAIGLAQAAAVAAQAPPSFHTGGVIASNPLAPDETMIVARKGEEVRTRQDQGAQSPITVQMVYQHRIFDSFVADNMKQAGSPLRREIHRASGRRVGHRG